MKKIPEAAAYTVSLLKSYWGDAATAENDFCFKYLPRLTGDHGTYATVMDMLADKLGEDRLEFRWKNAIRAGEPTATGQVLEASAGLASCL